MRFGFYSVDTRKVKGSVTQDCEGTLAGTTNAGNDTIDLKVDDPRMFDVTDELWVPSVSGFEFHSNVRSTKIPLALYVKEIHSDKIVVQAINGEFQNSTKKFLIPPIPKDAYIYRVTHASDEGSQQTVPYNVLPEPDELFMQIFKAQVMQTDISRDSEKRVDWNLDDQKEYALHQLRKDIELAYIVGVKGYFRNQDQKFYTYTCAGAIQQILDHSQAITYDEQSITYTDMLKNMVHPIFRGNSGSRTRYLFAGSDFVATIATLPEIVKQMNATQTLVKYGIDWRAIQFMSWQLNLYQHPLFDEIGLSKCALVLDLSNVYKCYFQSLHEDAVELKKAGLLAGESYVMTEISAIALKYPKTHAFIAEPSQYNPRALTVAGD